MKLTRDGLREITIATFVLGGGGGIATWAALSFSAWLWCIAAPMLALWVFTLAFFRDPARTVPATSGVLVAPADGKIVEVAHIDSYEGIDGPATRISIFLSIFNVHINRAPCDGRVIRTDYRPGEFLDARNPDSGHRNEVNTIFLDVEADFPGTVVVRQIAGAIARRIVCNVEPGATVRRGQRLGMIKFGSRTELIVPADSGFIPAVKLNDHVKAGSTILMTAADQTEGGHGGQSERISQEAVPALQQS
jgi:phosphatidylserine decarboxylase